MLTKIWCFYLFVVVEVYSGIRFTIHILFLLSFVRIFMLHSIPMTLILYSIDKKNCVHWPTKHPDIGFEYFPSFTLLCSYISYVQRLWGNSNELLLPRLLTHFFSPSRFQRAYNSNVYTLFLSLFSVLVVHFSFCQFQCII